MAAKSNFLEADDSVLEQNLKFVQNDLEDEFKQFFGASNKAQAAGAVAPPRDYKIVSTTPGFCVKCFKVNTNEKYFINVCQTPEIPAPEDITELELSQILNSDTPSSYRIPMSISDPRTTKDKSDNLVDACDIAINPQFFVKCEKSQLFKDFFLALISEALSEKYNVQLAIGKSIILTNRKFIGTLVSHRVRNTDVKTVLSSYKNPSEADGIQLQQLEQLDRKSSTKTLVQEIDENAINQLKQQMEQMKQKQNASSTKVKQDIALAASTVPEFKVRAKLRGSQLEIVEELQAEFYLPKCISAQEITLDIGEDRILLESMKHGYLFDKFFSYRLKQQQVSAIFDKTSKMLQVRIPVVPAH